MLGELESLQRRIADLEDTEIEVMERLETAQSGLDARTRELEEIDAKSTALESARAEKAADLERSLEEVAAQRSGLAADVPDDLLSLYTKLREQKGGVGAAALRRKECTGCRLTLNPSDLARITAAPSDEVIRCEECSRILVRTGESGL
jgi:predicted  nucleic acid-binding Zn-ribbon protein